jgi:hypothetical protein
MVPGTPSPRCQKAAREKEKIYTPSKIFFKNSTVNTSPKKDIQNIKNIAMVHVNKLRKIGILSIKTAQKR